MEKVAQCSFSLNIYVLKIMGIYPSTSHKHLNRVYSQTLYVLLLVPVSVLSILYFVLSSDFTNFTYNDFATVGMIFYPCKFLPLVFRRHTLKKCIHYFDEPYYSAVTGKHAKIVGECIYVCQRNSRFFFAGCCMATVTLVVRALVNMEELPFHAWVPKFVRERAVYYYMEYTLVVLGAVYATMACAAIDPLIGGLAYHATIQLQVLKEYLQLIDNQVEEFGSHDVYVEIKKCVQRYEKILIFVQEYQQCFSPVVFSQFTASSLVLGLVCLNISRLPINDISFFYMVNVFITLCFQIFFYCYYGTLLIEESKTLPSAIYMCKWYEYNLRCQKALNILMAQSQKPTVVTAGKLFELSLDTFTLILKRTYSVLAVLRNY